MYQIQKGLQMNWENLAKMDIIEIKKVIPFPATEASQKKG
jgi:hypothetical protein